MAAEQIPQTEMEKELTRELEEFQKEKDRVKKLLGSLGGQLSHKKENAVNILFLMVVLSFFTLEVTTHFLPPFVSLEVGLLILSIKIVWMMYSAQKVNHFQFWILNSIEYKVNQIEKRFIKLEKEIKSDSREEMKSGSGDLPR